MTVSKVGGANMIAHAQWPLCPPFSTRRRILRYTGTTWYMFCWHWQN